MALSEAEKRRRRFLKEKNKFNSFNELVKYHKNRDQTVWFDLEGNILQISAEQKRKKSVKERSVIFTAEQLEILKDKDVNLYRIVQDAEVETVFSIELKPLESPFVEHEKDFLQLIPESKSKIFDISVKYNKGNFTVKPHNKILKKYKDVDSNIATANGKKVLKFYFTSKNDPHFMIKSVNILLSDLLENKSVTKKLTKNLDQCSIYTIKLFDKYVCI